jgi:hypothetical protein
MVNCSSVLLAWSSSMTCTGSGPAHPHPWQDEAHAAAHAGLWRIAYTPRSALALAAALGYRGARK